MGGEAQTLRGCLKGDTYVAKEAEPAHPYRIRVFLHHQEENQTQEQQRLLSDAQITITTLQQQLADVSLAELEEQIVSIRFAQENLLAEQGLLTDNDVVFTQKLSVLQTDVGSVSASRLETNKRLLALTKQIDALDARLTAVAGPSAGQ